MTRSFALAVLCVVAGALACASPGYAEGPYGQAAPPSPPPAGPPPPPQGAPPPPYDPSASAPPTGAVPSGDWVYTDQYGWVYMPDGDPYLWVPPGGAGDPLEFVFLATAGWTWVSAPWVWGIGPRPHFSHRRPDGFAWYRHGWWRTPQRWHYVRAPGRRDRQVQAPREPREGGRGGGGEGGPRPGERGERGGARGGGDGARGGGERGGGGIHAPGRGDGRER